MDSHATPSADDKLIQLLRAYHELELRDLQNQGLPPPPVVTRRRPTGPGQWVEALWERRPAAATVNWPNQAARLRRGDDIPLDGWVQIYHKPGKPVAGGPPPEGRWFLRLFFPHAENQGLALAGPGDLLESCNNDFVDLSYARPAGLPHLLRLRLTYDRHGNLASEWQEVEPGYQPTQCQVLVRWLPHSVDPAGATSPARKARPSPASRRDERGGDVDPVWIDLGGEG